MATTGKEKRHQPSPRAVNSVRNLWTQMLGVKASPDATCAPGLLEACVTQEKLSKFECKNAHIFSFSLNTFKAAAEVAVENGGWESFNQLRREVYASSLPTLLASRKAKRSLGGQVRNLQKDIHDLRQRNQYLLRGRAILLSAYFDAIATLREARTRYPEMAEKLREHEARFDIRKQIEEAEVSDEESQRI